MTLDVQAIRRDFPALEQSVRGDKPLVYLDNAATTFKPQQVVDAVSQYYLSETANIHRGVHYLSEQATEQYELARQKVQRFINADAPEEIIFTSGTTAAINLVAQSLGQGYIKAGDEILITHMEHHSNIVPWQMLCEQIGCKLIVAPIDDDGDVPPHQPSQLRVGRQGRGPHRAGGRAFFRGVQRPSGCQQLR